MDIVLSSPETVPITIVFPENLKTFLLQNIRLYFATDDECFSLTPYPRIKRLKVETVFIRTFLDSFSPTSIIFCDYREE